MLTSHAVTEDRPPSRHARKLVRALDRMANEQFDSPEFRLLAETPLTMERAKFYSVQLVFYAANRRDCWAYVQARAPYDVKQAIWHHEQDELIHDPRGGTDHMALMSREAIALGMTEEEFAAARPTPLVRAALLAFTHLAFGIDPKLLASSNVHAVADEDHSNLIENAVLRHVTDEDSYNYKTALLGASECAQIDRAFRGALAHGMRAIED
jgi:hypothetical protein